MTGLVPVIHAAPFQDTPRISSNSTAWMTGTSPVTTASGDYPSMTVNAEGAGSAADACDETAAVDNDGPVMKDAASEARNSTSCAISCPFPDARNRYGWEI
jgi:hypothetical protein